MDKYQRTRFANNIVQSMGTIRGKRVAILGFAYKPDTSNTKNSPAIGLARALLDDGANIAIYDPQVWPAAAHKRTDLDERAPSRGRTRHEIGFGGRECQPVAISATPQGGPAARASA